MAELGPCGGSEIRLGSHTSTTTMTLFHDDFVSKLFKNDASNVGTSHRFALRSSTAMQVAPPHQCKEINPGKPENVLANDEEDYKPPNSLPPIRVPSASAFNHSPSSSRAQSPSSSTNKVMIKSIVMNVKRPENNSPHRSPLSHVSSPKERKSVLSVACYGHLQSPSAMSVGVSEGSFNGEDLTPSRLSNSLIGRSPMLYSPCTPSPYYFSPLSNTSSHNLNVTSPRSSIQSDTSHDASIEPCTHESHMHIGSKSGTLKQHDSHGALPNSPRSITTSFSDAEDSSQEIEGKSDGNPLSFASPEMEILDDGPPTSNLNSMRSTMKVLHRASRGAAKSTMADFIKRGGPMMHRSFSTSRVTSAEDQHRPKPVLKKYYSAQYSGVGHGHKGANDSTSSVLDELFPLKQPDRFKQGANVALNRRHISDSTHHVGMEESVSKSSRGMVVGDDKTMVSKVLMMSPLAERPAQEVNIMQGGDGDDGFAYSPVASAFVFSPRRASTQNSYFMRSASSSSWAAATKYKESNLANDGDVTEKEGSMEMEKSSFSDQYMSGADERGESTRASVGEETPDLKSSTRASWGSPKISSVLLRFAEAQERLYNSAPASPHHLPSAPPTSCLPMCSFLGRTFSCQSKFAATARQFQE
ncbi:hypothetical protein GOP47_0019892 [Adiantum capillus-veneris]|uniref:Uncharacterized protein n=1 Tax=Adiantum capillus-veneris TaxID=13818 RepID=A0A9D4Z916_ADICA|nr:hypothetical protein GOP47_0019892 [Adiantum capillus-veneris]